MIKRIFDIIFSLLVLICFSPIFILLIILVKITTKGPWLFKHKRIGKEGKEFFIYKFRTMVLNAEKIGPGLTVKGDPRVTPFGSFLRKTSLDELPNFINVLTGDMSVVGPRPEIPEYVQKYSIFQYQVLKINPGVTGFPQINGRADLTIKKKLRLDVYYLKHYNICFDIYIILKTIIVLITQKGAF